MSVHIAALQLGSASIARLDFYLRLCKENGVSLVLLAEYCLSPFFNELKELDKAELKTLWQSQKARLAELAKSYEIHIITPMVGFKNGKMLKLMAHFSPKFSRFYPQQILIPYPHWNEADFFDNKKLNAAALKPRLFSLGGLKVGLMFGFEAHFSPIWDALAKGGAHLVLVPSAGAFGSASRWRALLGSKALCYGMAVLRANRVGSCKAAKPNEPEWSFYGDSFLAMPNGEISLSLGDKEELFMLEFSKKEILKLRKDWGFYQIAKDFWL